MTTERAVEGWVMDMSFPLGTVFHNEPEVTVTGHHECTNSLRCLF